MADWSDEYGLMVCSRCRMPRGNETDDGKGHHWGADMVSPSGDGGYSTFARGEGSDAETALGNLEDKLDSRLRQEVLGMKMQLDTKRAALNGRSEP